MVIIDDADIIYAISTGDTKKEDKMILLRKHIESVRRGERIRVANKIMDNEFWEDSQ